jgi:bifunctional N-acetylglucosamine-1-phosphate-uridyltransferase/glucosamine-1-phosphate-acetyltransferase GlmU-like protein
MNRVLIIPAAGRGSRLQSAMPKVLYPIAGRPMIDHLLDLYRGVIDHFVLVVSPPFEEAVRRHCSARQTLAGRIAYAVQQQQNGMLPAILTARPLVEQREADSVWITWCDQIAVRPETVGRLCELAAKEPPPDLIFPTVHKCLPYIHFDRDAEGRITAVRQRREGDRMPETGEGDSGLFALSRRAYLDYLPAFAAVVEEGAGTGERNFLPFIPWMSARATVATYSVQEELESMGVNTQSDARSIEEYLSTRA